MAANSCTFTYTYIHLAYTCANAHTHTVREKEKEKNMQVFVATYAYTPPCQLTCYCITLAVCSSSADGLLSLGDEILSVNGRSLLGFNHAQAVEALQSCGPDVTLCVRPNHTYRGGYIYMQPFKSAVVVCNDMCTCV